MESKEIIRILNEIEESFPVDKWSVDDLDIWPYLRFKISSKLFDGKSSFKGNTFYMRYVKNIYKYFRNNITFSLSRKKKTDFLFVENGVHIADINGAYYFTRTDSIRDKLEKLGYGCKTLIGGYKVETPLYNSGEFFQYSLDWIFILNKLKGIFKKDGELKYNLDDYESFLSFLKQKGIYSNDLELKNLLRQIYRIKSIERYFIKILKKLKPKAVFILCYYSTYGFGMILACKKLDIPIIDIQHGVQGDYHYAYGSYKKVPEKGYNLHPDIFYVWSDAEKNSLLKWVTKNTKIFVGGNNFLDMWKDNSNEIVKKYIYMLREKYSLNKYSKVILYTVDPQEKNNEKVIKAIQESPSDWFWFVRVHPKEVDMLEYTKEKIGDVECGWAINDIHTLPIYSLLKVSDVHVTHRSSTIIEAADFGIKSIVTSKSGIDLFKEYCNHDMMMYASSWKEILEHIKNLKKEKQTVKINKERDIIELVKIIENI